MKKTCIILFSTILILASVNNVLSGGLGPCGAYDIATRCSYFPYRSDCPSAYNYCLSDCAGVVSNNFGISYSNTSSPSWWAGLPWQYNGYATNAIADYYITFHCACVFGYIGQQWSIPQCGTSGCRVDIEFWADLNYYSWHTL